MLFRRARRSALVKGVIEIIFISQILAKFENDTKTMNCRLSRGIGDARNHEK